MSLNKFKKELNNLGLYGDYSPDASTVIYAHNIPDIKKIPDIFFECFDIWDFVSIIREQIEIYKEHNNTLSEKDRLKYEKNINDIKLKLSQIEHTEDLLSKYLSKLQFIYNNLSTGKIIDEVYYLESNGHILIKYDLTSFKNII